jgi:hypothetical protein
VASCAGEGALAPSSMSTKSWWFLEVAKARNVIRGFEIRETIRMPNVSE